MSAIPTLLLWAWLLPLLSFAVIWVGYSLIDLAGRKPDKVGEYGGFVATGAIGSSFVLSLVALIVWLASHGVHQVPVHGDEEHAAAPAPAVRAQSPETDGHAEESGSHEGGHADGEHHEVFVPPAMFNDWYLLGQFGDLRITIGYYIDALTVTMFCMVTLIATCIHFYAFGYMHEELHDVTDHLVMRPDGEHLHRRGRFHRFFQSMSLFCFSMLGLVIAGNIAMVFVFWELVGICSYFLIGFYFERQSASTAANKAFIVNRVGDFGMIIGLMALFGALGTFSFGDELNSDGSIRRSGIFSQVRAAENNYGLQTPDGMVRASASSEIKQVAAHALAAGQDPEAAVEMRIDEWRNEGYGYGLLIVAGLGIFCGCIGKSAQFPLHVWLPDAMEGPTPVSALVHSATMVAAGVYLVGRFFPVFTPEVLLVIAYVGCITLFLAATIAITATDIKRVLAYSTVSQLGYMMMALGVGGWLAGLYHLITHAFFKSLLFLCSGSVIHAVHTNEMPLMGGLRKKMPWTAYTMLVGCLAIIGAGIPFIIGFSGYYSKDAILEQALSFWQHNPLHGFFFVAAAGGAAITAFYMFRLWYMTFAGEPRDLHRYEHAHESPKVMYVPLVVLAVFAVCVAWPFDVVTGYHVPSLVSMLEQARPAGTLADQQGALWASLFYANEHASHAAAIKTPATLIAFATALTGFLFATAFYGVRWLNPREAAHQFRRLYRFLLHKWWFDELYDFVIVRPVHLMASLAANIDKRIIDRIIDTSAAWTRRVADALDTMIDRPVVDGTANRMAEGIYSFAVWVRGVQSGNLRQYVMFIVLGTVVLFMLIGMLASGSFAGS